MIGRLGYNSKTNRYGIIANDIWQDDGLHCGECLQVRVDDSWVQTRIEMSLDNKWYLVDTPYKGNLENIQVKY